METNIRVERALRGFRIFIDIGRETWVIYLENVSEAEAWAEAEEMARQKRAA